MEFEHTVVKALACAYQGYECVLFGGTFLHPDSGARKPDLALVARDLSHWFVVEVELTSHSLDHHVLPQVRAFVFGEPQGDCVSVLANRLAIDRGRAATIVRHVPRSVAVVANRRDDAWASALRGLPAQLLVVSQFKTESGAPAVEIEGGTADSSSVHPALEGELLGIAGAMIDLQPPIEAFPSSDLPSVTARTYWMPGQEPGQLTKLSLTP